MRIADSGVNADGRPARRGALLHLPAEELGLGARVAGGGLQAALPAGTLVALQERLARKVRPLG
jgi:hypothetical protein